jgi:hypothetical protein
VSEDDGNSIARKIHRCRSENNIKAGVTGAIETSEGLL